MKLIDKTGKRFGSLVVQERVPRPEGIEGKSEAWWLCLCDCGNESFVRAGSLRDGLTKSCGCGQGHNRLRPYEALYKRVRRDNTVRLRSLEFTLTYEEFLEFTKIDKCHYCWSPIKWQEYSSNGTGYNLDRAENSKGYSKDNVVPCCGRCNMGKRDTFSYDEWYGMTAYFRNRKVEK
jgi:hypothetical protein